MFWLPLILDKNFQQSLTGVVVCCFFMIGSFAYFQSKLVFFT